MQYFQKTQIDFVGIRKQFFMVSLIVTILGLGFLLFKGPVFGIEFEGGTEIAMGFESNVSAEELRSAVAALGHSESEIKSFGADNQYLIRVKDMSTGKTTLGDELKEKFASANPKILKVDKIGPTIGQEMRQNAFIAVALSVIMILLYIAFRFEFVFGMGAVVALLHDVFLTFSLIVIVHHTGLINIEIGESILAAMLTVVGYSINDTVIIFDRIRENRELHKGMDFTKLINLSVNETLSRTVNTVGTTLIVLTTIVAFGGPVLQGFAFTMALGIIIGTYSSMYIASSFVIWYLEKVKKVDLSHGIKSVSNV